MVKFTKRKEINKIRTKNKKEEKILKNLQQVLRLKNNYNFDTAKI